MSDGSSDQQDPFPLPFQQMPHRQDRRLDIVEGKDAVNTFRHALSGIIQQNGAGQRAQQRAQFLFRKSADQQIGRRIGFPRLRKHPEKFLVGTVGHPDYALIALRGQQTDHFQHQFRMETGDGAVEFARDDLHRPGMEILMPLRLASRIEGRQISQFRGCGEDPAAGFLRHRRQLTERARYRHGTHPAFGRDPVQRYVVPIAPFHLFALSSHTIRKISYFRKKTNKKMKRGLFFSKKRLCLTTEMLNLTFFIDPYNHGGDKWVI